MSDVNAFAGLGLLAFAARQPLRVARLRAALAITYTFYLVMQKRKGLAGRNDINTL